MRKRYAAGLIAAGSLSLLGCAQQQAPVTAAQAVSLVQSGQPLLKCREECLGEWQRAAPQAAQLDAAARWPDLAALVVRVGYQDDLSLYYLGRAAEGLGYPGAAASYYRQSTYVTGTAIACQQRSRNCGGLVFPNAAVVRLAAIERELTRARPRRMRPAGKGTEPAAVPQRQSVEQPTAVPEAAAVAPAPPPVVAPPPVAAPPLPPAPGTSDFIEPPPARH